MISVPPPAVRDAAFEAIENGIKLIVIVTERIPRLEVAQIVEYAKPARRAHHRPELPGRAVAGEVARRRHGRRGGVGAQGVHSRGRSASCRARAA